MGMRIGLSRGTQERRPGRTSGGAGVGSGGDAAARHPIDPDPFNWTVKKSRQVGTTLVVMINYPNCTNFEGNKILVLTKMTLKKLQAQKDLDPHFLESNPKLLARFKPNGWGWSCAIKFAQLLNQLAKQPV